MEEFKSTLQYPPKNAWNAILVQLFCWSFRRFCVERLSADEISELWDDLLVLVADYAPPQFQSYIDHWLAPEQVANVANVRDLDQSFRLIITKLDKSIEENDTDIQDKLSTFFDEEMSRYLEQWLGTVYAPFSMFPSPMETDTDIDLTKLNAIVYLLGRQPSLDRTKRKTLRSRRAFTPVKSQLRKTRHSKLRAAAQPTPNETQYDISTDALKTSSIKDNEKEEA